MSTFSSSVLRLPAHSRRCQCPAFLLGRRQRHGKRPAQATPDNPDGGGRELASEFSQLVNSAGIASPLANRRPSHMLPPNAVVSAQLEALQRNDWPEPDAGVRAAFAFAKPLHAEDFTPLAVPSHVRSWQAKEAWLDWEQFQQLLHSPPYDAMLGCAEWRIASNLVFPSRRHENRAVMAVEVAAARRPAAGRGQGAQQERSGERKYTFTFCLERVEKGPYKGCWLTVGVRDGDYANV